MDIHKSEYLYFSLYLNFKFFKNLYVNSLPLKFTFNKKIINFLLKWEHHCTRGGVLHFYMRVLGHVF